MSPFWDRAWRMFYWFVTRLGPLVRPWVRRFGLGNVVELIVPGRSTGRPRGVLLGLLRVDGGWYVGHPNGRANWTRNLDAAGGQGRLEIRREPAIQVRADVLPDGDERRRVIEATWHQHVQPGRLLYWLARRHILAVGRYYRVERVAPDEAPDAAPDAARSPDPPGP